MSIVLFIFLVISGVVIYVMYLRSRDAKNLADKKMKEMEAAITAAKLENEKSINALKEMHTQNQYEAFSGKIISQMNQGIVYISQDRTVQLANHYAEQYLETTPAVGKLYQQVLHFETNGQRDYSLFEMALTGRSQTISDNFNLVSQRGKTPVIGTITPLMTNNSVDAIVFIFTDNSENFVKVQEEKAFFSAAAHDLRTPLTAIRMSVSLLLKQFDTLGKDKIIEYLQKTDEAIVHLVNLVNDFLNISRIDQGRLVVENKPFDMVKVTDQVIQELSLLAKERNIYLNHKPVEVEYRNVIGDPTKSMEVLTNLLSNSIKYTIQGGITVSHTLTNTTLITKITDTGIGIPEDSKGLLFKRFFQIGGARQQSSSKGSGLGLYIAKKIAKLMNGDVALESSEPGKGSTFTFTLPLVPRAG
jgi:signal transduction histidine kinase